MYEQEKYLLRTKAARRLRVRDEQAVHVLVLPEFSRRTSKTPKWRVEKLRDHLKLCADGIATTAVTGLDEKAPKGGAGPEIEGKMCRVCRGSCCQEGKEHAYLTHDTLNEAAMKADTHDRSVLVEAWLAHVPERTYHGSCIYHGAQGCGLPREMRSETCTTYTCSAIRQVRSESSDAGKDFSFLSSVRRKDDDERVILVRRSEP